MCFKSCLVITELEHKSLGQNSDQEGSGQLIESGITGIKTD